MALSRSAYNLLRTRPVAGVSAPLVRRVQRRNLDQYARREDLGGPTGQQKQPQKNWMAIAAGAVMVFAGLRYWSSLEKPVRTHESDLKAAFSTEIGYLPQPTPGSKPLDRNREIHAFSELSGRKGGGSMGPFRAE